MDKSQSPISALGEFKPFLVIYTHSQQRKSWTHRRQKRSATCRPGVNECCKESLYISFADIGWSDWIVKPERYDAYFCRGSCMTQNAAALSATVHNSMLHVSIAIIILASAKSVTGLYTLLNIFFLIELFP